MGCSACQQARESAAKAAMSGLSAATNLASGRVTQARREIAKAVLETRNTAGFVGQKFSGKNFLPKRPVK